MLSYELMQKVDNMASQFTQFVNMTVNGIPYGLYTLIEDIDKDILT
jgi:CotH kinase protein